MDSCNAVGDSRQSRGQAVRSAGISLGYSRKEHGEVAKRERDAYRSVHAHCVCAIAVATPHGVNFAILLAEG